MLTCIHVMMTHIHVTCSRDIEMNTCDVDMSTSDVDRHTCDIVQKKTYNCLVQKRPKRDHLMLIGMHVTCVMMIHGGEHTWDALSAGLFPQKSHYL